MLSLSWDTGGILPVGVGDIPVFLHPEAIISRIIKQDNLNLNFIFYNLTLVKIVILKGNQFTVVTQVYIVLQTGYRLIKLLIPDIQMDMPCCWI